MMVVHEDSETPVEVALIRKPLLEQKPYVIVKNHVRELINCDESTSSNKVIKEKSTPSSRNVEKRKRKSDQTQKINDEVVVNSEKDDEKTNTGMNIDTNDLQELKSVYTKCKEVMRKIETKYGHLLGLDCEAGPSSNRKRKASTAISTDEECDCKLNKKIVFDDDGQQSTVEMLPDNHICVKKSKNTHSDMKTRSKQIAIEYTEKEVILPESLKELSTLLQDPNLEKPLRNKIVDKMRLIKLEYVNEIKFNKPALIEKLKVNPDEVLGFKGTNLSSISGYL